MIILQKYLNRKKLERKSTMSDKDCDDEWGGIFLFLFYFGTGSCHIVQVDIEAQPSQYWDYRCAPPHLA
jgi:hypothetical protein